MQAGEDLEFLDLAACRVTDAFFSICRPDLLERTPDSKKIPPIAIAENQRLGHGWRMALRCAARLHSSIGPSVLESSHAFQSQANNRTD